MGTPMSNGDCVGAYTLRERVGVGASASVYRADGPDGTEVAVKLFSGTLDERQQRRFHREAELLADLRHPNVLGLVDAGVDADRGAYLVTPLLQGSTLRAFIAERDLPPAAIVALLTVLLQGLAAIHAKGVVHRDLKPENVLVTRDGRLVIMDLGLALHGEHTRLTSEGAVAGSVPYMSPEQIEGRSLSATSDVWSLGVIAYECLTGRRPFQRTSQTEEVAAILSGIYPPLDEADRRVSPELARALTACLTRETAQRPGDAAALREKLLATPEALDVPDPAATLERLTAAPETFPEELLERARQRHLDAARAAISSRDSFTAIAHLDAALAHGPEDETLRKLIDEATSVQLESSGTSTAPPAVQSMSGRSASLSRRRLPLSAAGILVVVSTVFLLLVATGAFETHDAVPSVPPAVAAASPISLPAPPVPIPAPSRPPAAPVKSQPTISIRSSHPIGTIVEALVKSSAKDHHKATKDTPYKPTETDQVTFELAGGFAQLWVDVVTKSHENEEGLLVLDELEARRGAVRMFGNIVRLMALKVEDEATKP